MKSKVKKRVVITGASSGIGRASVFRMLEAGWQVFATVRKSEDAEKLHCEAGTDVAPLIMDITARDTIARAAHRISSQLSQSGLDGLVNVAGIGMMRPLEYATASDLQKIFDINVFGQIAVTQAFLPLLRKARGRIVNISSVGAHIAIPFGGLLNASKSAFGALSNTLRVELRPFGVRVSTIEPGAIKTPAVDKTLGDVDSVISSLPGGDANPYAKMLKTFAQRAYAQEAGGSPPEVVATAVHHALTSRRPRLRYRAGKHANLLATLPGILPEGLMDALVIRMLGLAVKTG
ncbi:MAG TPA: SDR family oxidoreductase [Terriglobales bacterium]|nr:SDR family oxidoreductase [Terriglobales bacterium]